jgi:hypothetical protein
MLSFSTQRLSWNASISLPKILEESQIAILNTGKVTWRKGSDHVLHICQAKSKGKDKHAENVIFPNIRSCFWQFKKYHSENFFDKWFVHQDKAIWTSDFTRKCNRDHKTRKRRSPEVIRDHIIARLSVVYIVTCAYHFPVGPPLTMTSKFSRDFWIIYRFFWITSLKFWELL